MGYSIRVDNWRGHNATNAINFNVDQIQFNIMPEQAKKTSAEQPKGPSSETIFRNINILIMTLFAFTLNGFLKFREATIERGILVFGMPSLAWCLGGFLVRFITKYSYMWLSHGALSWALSKKEQPEEERQYRLKSIKKLSFDFFFYTAVTVWGYYLFHQQSWFPSIIGGQGQCQNICKNYPGWPSNPQMSVRMQEYFMAQMGINLFSLIELGIFIGKSYRKYHQFLLHHCVTIILILFATLSNQFAAGIIVISIHNGSDIFSSGARAYLETKFARPSLLAIFFVAMLGSWVYMRLFVYPTCVLRELIAQMPGPDDYWFVMRFEYGVYMSLNCILVGMHCFWIYFMLKFAVKNAKGGKLENVHEAATPGRKTK